MTVYLARIYEVVKGAEEVHGEGIMVDRLWPRGISKEETADFIRLADVAPSTELREWFEHDDAKFPEFAEKYKAELTAGVKNGNEELEKLISLAKAGDVTLIYAERDTHDNNAVVLKEWLDAYLEK